MSSEMRHHPFTESTIRHFQKRHERPLSQETENRNHPVIFETLLSYLRVEIGEMEETKKEKMEHLVQEMEQAAFRYIESRVEFLKQTMTNGKSERREDLKIIENVDRNRRLAHIRLVDSVRIACRNVVQETGISLPEKFSLLIGSGEDYATRERVARAVIDYTWKLLEQDLEEAA